VKAESEDRGSNFGTTKGLKLMGLFLSRIYERVAKNDSLFFI
jgi:hypothetical protein